MEEENIMMWEVAVRRAPDLQFLVTPYIKQEQDTSSLDQDTSKIKEEIVEEEAESAQQTTLNDDIDIYEPNIKEEIEKINETRVTHPSTSFPRGERVERVSPVKHVECDICHEIFVNKQMLVNHVKRIHASSDNVTDPPYSTDLERKNRVCNICQKKFSTFRTLVIHKRIHSGEKPYECNICEKRFSDRSCFVRHVRVHSDDKPYECDVCQKRYSDSSGLSRHKRLHSSEKPFECNVCHNRFIYSSQLNKHKRTYCGEKSYECDICQEKFIDSSSLIKHKSIHSSEKPYKCDICRKRYRMSFNLSKHKRIIHSS